MVQVPLMRVVDSAVAAMDAHRGVAAVAEHGLRFLWNESCSRPIMVRRQATDWFVVIQGVWGEQRGAGA